MRLQNFYAAAKEAKEKDGFLAYGIEAIAADKELATHIQEILVWLNFLDPPSDGKFGAISTEAFIEFQETMSQSIPDLDQEKGFLGLITAKALIETSPDKVPNSKVDTSLNNLESRIIKYMMKMNYRVSVGDRKYNIVYAEGMDADGSLNADRRNEFNDRRMVIEIPDSNHRPIMRHNVEATTEPGTHYTLNPMNPDGAARIAFGQYKAWRIGEHCGHGGNCHEALVQVAPVTVHRDKNKDTFRTGDKLDTGLFGINQHWGFDYPRNDIKLAGAGCLVGRETRGHKDFMALIKQDKRYQTNKNYKFLTTIIAGDDLLKQVPM